MKDFRQKYLILKIKNEKDLLDYEFHDNLEYLFSKWFGSINGFYDLVPLDHLQKSFKKGIYHFDYKLGDEKETTMIINFKALVNDEVLYHYFPFPSSGILNCLIRDIRLDRLLY
jgi:hypothetical protein